MDLIILYCESILFLKELLQKIESSILSVGIFVKFSTQGFVNYDVQLLTNDCCYVKLQIKIKTNTSGLSRVSFCRVFGKRPVVAFLIRKIAEKANLFGDEPSQLPAYGIESYSGNVDEEYIKRSIKLLGETYHCEQASGIQGSQYILDNFDQLKCGLLPLLRTLASKVINP